MSETSELFDQMEQAGFEYEDDGVRTYEFNRHEDLASFLLDSVMNCLIETVQIDYRNTRAIVTPAAPGIDRLDRAAKRNSGVRL